VQNESRARVLSTGPAQYPPEDWNARKQRLEFVAPLDPQDPESEPIRADARRNEPGNRNRVGRPASQLEGL
jgi:hypothetical protein